MFHGLEPLAAGHDLGGQLHRQLELIEAYPAIGLKNISLRDHLSHVRLRLIEPGILKGSLQLGHLDEAGAVFVQQLEELFKFTACEA